MNWTTIDVFKLGEIITNIREVPKSEDRTFKSVDEVLRTKRGSCSDVALLVRDWAKAKHVEYAMATIGIKYKPENEIVYSYQAHIICLVKLRNWTVVQNSFLNYPIYTGNLDIVRTLKDFAKVYLPLLESELRKIKKIEVNNYYYKIFDKNDDFKIEATKNLRFVDKQKFLFDLSQNVLTLIIPRMRHN